MPQDYKLLTESVKDRINPDHLAFQRSFDEELGTLSYSGDVLVYVRLAMKGVPPEYTRRSRLAGERVKDHLSSLTNVSFRYQGSVMTNTHIIANSDIDLLTISDKFYYWDASSAKKAINENIYPAWQSEKLNREFNYSSYTGNVLDDLHNLRMDCERILSDKYSVCNIAKPKSIKIRNLDLKRDVDVVIANYYDDVLAILNDKIADYRGIQVYNKDTRTRGIPDYPFLSISRINSRGDETVGRIKKMIRFLKNLKAKSKADIILSSFDFNAICYEINPDSYKNLAFYELVPVLYRQTKSLSQNKWHSDSLMSVDGREPIFLNNPEKLSSLQAIHYEISIVYNDLLSTGKLGKIYV
ncbi:hypothetical protein [Hymenobacter cavernae]|uniref:cGAS/DncV-like nucleotidyltransferase C-terminal helical domain-containing protein n=1 Tax=Hymenobacter cavernae TaxID=2044852 RepID=A0ABQ1UWQ4_9BACT|nr:hypothetical protein [Hymenobacter cavernae]GGF27009.1 hypothetical protein GCM10011383_43220 [Hymenobacter cavernae]